MLKWDLSTSSALHAGPLFARAQIISGFSRKTIIVFQPIEEDWTISFEVEKKDDSTSQLKVVIKLIDGALLREAQTTEPHGKVSLKLAIE